MREDLKHEDTGKTTTTTTPPPPTAGTRTLPLPAWNMDLDLDLDEPRRVATRRAASRTLYTRARCRPAPDWRGRDWTNDE